MSEDERVYRGYPKRLKYRYFKLGMGSMLESEVLELLLHYARPRQDVRQLAEGLIGRFGDFQGVLDTPMDGLTAFPGMDADCAMLLKLARDSSDLYLKNRLMSKTLMRNWDDFIKYCRTSMQGLKKEQFRVVFLNAQNEVIALETIEEGTVNKAAVFPRIIIERAFGHNATGLVLVHNHTSGNPAPSKADLEITRTMATIASNLDIGVYDHIIVGGSGYFSFRESGLIEDAPRDLIVSLAERI